MSIFYLLGQKYGHFPTPIKCSYFLLIENQVYFGMEMRMQISLIANIGVKIQSMKKKKYFKSQ